MSAEALNDLLRAVINRRADESPSGWPLNRFGAPSPPGIVAIWRILNRNPADEDALKAVLEDSIKSYSRKNLALIEELLHYFATLEPKLPSLLSRKSLEELRQAIENEMATMSENEIIESLSGAGPSVLLRCSWSLDRLRRGDLKGLPFQGWAKFSERLQGAIERAPAVVTPQAVPFIVSDSSSSGDSNRPIFDEEKARRLFDFDRLIQLLSVHRLEEPDVPEAVAKKYRAVMDWIENWPPVH